MSTCARVDKGIIPDPAGKGKNEIQVPVGPGEKIGKIHDNTEISRVLAKEEGQTDKKELDKSMRVPGTLFGTDNHQNWRIFVEIVGLHDPLCSQNCENYFACGEIVKVDTILSLKKVKIWVMGKEEIAFAVYLVEQGLLTCHVGFLCWYIAICRSSLLQIA